jgi:hypothetical protein
MRAKSSQQLHPHDFYNKNNNDMAMKITYLIYAYLKRPWLWRWKHTIWNFFADHENKDLDGRKRFVRKERTCSFANFIKWHIKKQN